MTQPTLAFTRLAVSRGLFALLTTGILIVTFYFAILGLGVVLNTSTDLPTRAEGLLLLLPYLALVLMLVGLLPPVRGHALLWLGITVGVLLLPSVVACFCSRSSAAPMGAMVAAGYAVGWWLLVKAKLG